MRLRRIEVENFRSLRYVNIKVNQNPLVILGENNVGKSNLLLALRLLLGKDAQRLRLDLSEEDINKTAREENELFFQITLEIGDLQKHSEVEACFKERINTDGEEHFIRIQGKYDRNTDGEYTWESLLLSPENRSNESMRLSRRMYEAVPLFFMEAIRDGEREIRATGTGMLSQLLQDVEYDDVEDDVLAGLQEANSALSSSDQIRSLSTDLTQQLGNLVPGGQGELRIAVADEDMSQLSSNLRLQIRKRPEELHAALSRQGTGMQNLILISMFRHLMQKKQEETWKKTPILCIEEPESHLHPHAQRRLYRDLCQINVPTFITTHSPALVKYADPSSLIILRSDAPNEVSAYQLSSTFQLENKKQLSQLMRLDGAEVFFSRVIIAVEGDSELIVLPAFAEELGCDLDRDGISILNVGSTNSFEPILRAFADSELSVKCVVIYDQDALRNDPSLVKQAQRLDLVTDDDYQSCRKESIDVFDKRVSLLNCTIGWFGAEECFEEIVAQSGYLNTMIQAIKDKDKVNCSDYEALKKYLSDKNLALDTNSLVQFIKDKKRNDLKVPMAHAVADVVQTTKNVPECFASAIRHATLLSLGGIIVDEYFEERACGAGFRAIFLKLLDNEGLTANFNSFADEKSQLSERQILQSFFSSTDEGRAIRDKARLAIADAVDYVGCSKFADSIRDATFPNCEV